MEVSTFLSTETEFLNDSTVTVDVLLCEVVEHTTTLTYEHLHRTACSVILVVCAEVISEVSDAEREQCDLSLWRTSVSSALTILCEDFFLLS